MARDISQHFHRNSNFRFFGVNRFFSIYKPIPVKTPIFSLYSSIQSWLPQSGRQKARGNFSCIFNGNLSSRQYCSRSVRDAFSCSDTQSFQIHECYFSLCPPTFIHSIKVRQAKFMKGQHGYFRTWRSYCLSHSTLAAVTAIVSQ